MSEPDKRMHTTRLELFIHYQTAGRRTKSTREAQKEELEEKTKKKNEAQ